MLNEKQLKEKRETLSNRINQIEGNIRNVQQQIQDAQKEAIALRGQVVLINELLGEETAPPPPVENAQKPKPKPPRKRSKAHGR